LRPKWWRIRDPKQFKIIKNYSTKPNWSSTAGCRTEGELIQRWVMNEAQYKGEVKRLWISSLTTEAIKEGFKILNHPQTTIIYTTPDFPELLATGYRYECHAIVHRKTWIQTSFVYWCKPQHWQWSWTDSKRSRILNHSRIGNYKRCIETRFSVMRKGVFEKEDGEILANKVKESIRNCFCRKERQ
jgi:hypothetical protein